MGAVRPPRSALAEGELETPSARRWGRWGRRTFAVEVLESDAAGAVDAQNAPTTIVFWDRTDTKNGPRLLVGEESDDAQPLFKRSSVAAFEPSVTGEANLEC